MVYVNSWRQLLLTIIISIFYYLNSGAYEYEKKTISIQAEPFSGQSVKVGYYLGTQTYLLDSLSLNHKGEGLFNLIDHKGIYVFVFENGEVAEIMTDNNADIYLKIYDPSLSDYIVEGNAVAEGYNEYLSLSKSNNTTDRETINSEIGKLAEININNLLGSYLQCILPVKPPETNIPRHVNNPDSFKWKTDLSYYKEHYLENLILTEPGLIYTPVLEDKTIRYFTRMVKQKPSNITAALKAFFLKEMHPDVKQFLFQEIFQHYASSSHKPLEEYVYLFLIREYFLAGKTPWAGDRQIEALSREYNLRFPSSLLQPAPEVNLPDNKGRKHELSATETAYTLLVFWDYSCDHCKRALEDIVESWKRYNSADITMYTIYTGLELNVWEAYLNRELPKSWTNVQYASNTLILEKYNIDRLPSLFLLNSNHVIVDKYLTATDLDMFLKELTSGKKKQKKTPQN